MTLMIKKSMNSNLVHFYDECGAAKKIVKSNEEALRICPWCEKKRRESYDDVTANVLD